MHVDLCTSVYVHVFVHVRMHVCVLKKYACRERLTERGRGGLGWAVSKRAVGGWGGGEIDLLRGASLEVEGGAIGPRFQQHAHHCHVRVLHCSVQSLDMHNCVCVCVC